MQSEMERFLALFFEEATEHVATMESSLLELEHSPGNREILNGIFRCAHSIKGASGTFGLDDVARFTHALESLLDRMRSGALDSSPERLDLLLRAADVLRELLVSARIDGPPPVDAEEVLSGLNSILQPEPKAAASLGSSPAPVVATPSGMYRVVLVPDRDILRQGMDPFLLLRDLSLVGEILETEADLSRLPSWSEFDPEDCYLAWSIQLRTEQTATQIGSVFAYVEDSVKVTIEPLPHTQPSGGDRERILGIDPSSEPFHACVPVKLEKAGRLLETVTALLCAEERLVQAANDFGGL